MLRLVQLWYNNNCNDVARLEVVASTAAEIFEKFAKGIMDELPFPIDGIPRFNVA